MSQNTCSLDDCQRTDIAARGWCCLHYGRWIRNGTHAAPPKANVGQCAVDGCDSDARTRGWCRKHYTRQLRHGSMHPTRAQPRSVHPGAQGYMVQHNPDHPLADANGTVYYHRLVMWDRLDGQPTTCAFCARAIGWSVPGGDSISVEHLDGDRQNNHPLNLVAACFSCNAKRVRWIERHSWDA